MVKSGSALRFVKRALDLGSSIALAALLVAVVAILVAPHIFGIRYGILRSGSMSPAMPAGAAIVVAPAAADSIGPGDVITYRSAGNRDLLVTHRVHEVAEDESGKLAFRTKGDGNEEPDSALVTPDRVLGRVEMSVPHVGKVAQSLNSRAGFFLLMVMPAALIIALELRELARGIADLRRGRKDGRAGDELGSAA